MAVCLAILEFFAALLAIASGRELVFFTVATSCEGFKFLGIELILIGQVLLILSCVTCALFRKPIFGLIMFLYGAFPLFLALFGLGVFAMAVGSQGGGESIPGRSYKEYHVESYSKWMQNKVNVNWEIYYKEAVVRHMEYVCADVIFNEYHPNGAYPAFKLGCCEPPKDCGFNYTNPKVYSVRPENNNYTNDDCNKWDNDPNTLCFDCQSCKAGFLEDVTSRYFIIGSIFVALGIFFILLMAYFVLAIITSGSCDESSKVQSPNATLA